MTSTKRHRINVRDDIPAERLRLEARTSSSRRATKLLALASVLEGKSYAEVAKQHGVSLASIYYWLHCFNASGLQNLEARGRKCHLRVHGGITVEGLISAAKAADADGSRRLIAISKLLAESPCRKVAREAKVSPSTLSAWIKRFNETGISGLLEKKVDSSRAKVILRDDISLADIQAAAQSAPRRICRRLEAISLVLDGMNCREAADRLGVSMSAVGKWCKRFNEAGIDGLIGRCDARIRRSQLPTTSEDRQGHVQGVRHQRLLNSW
jgi:transposase